MTQQSRQPPRLLKKISPQLCKVNRTSAWHTGMCFVRFRRRLPSGGLINQMIPSHNSGL
jgi:hypothetical protein